MKKMKDKLTLNVIFANRKYVKSVLENIMEVQQ